MDAATKRLPCCDHTWRSSRCSARRNDAGISGRSQSFGYGVISVLMSLFVARMITPLIAAYFLKAHGPAPHASGKYMERYLGILRWSLDTSKADARLATLRPEPARWYHYPIGILLVLVRVLAFGAGVGAGFNC